MTSRYLVATWLALLIGCAGAPPPGGEPSTATPRCADRGGCDLYPRECGMRSVPACANCGGMTNVCVPRTAQDIALLDRLKMHCDDVRGGVFSYTDSNCQRDGERLWSELEVCELQGGRFDAGADPLYRCVIGSLQRPGLVESEPTPRPKTWGPLSHSIATPELSRDALDAARRTNEKRRTSQAERRIDVAQFQDFVSRAVEPRTDEQRQYVEYAHTHSNLLIGLQGYAIDAVASGLHSSGERVHVCVRAPGISWKCDPYLVEREPADQDAEPYTVGLSDDGFATIELRDLSDATNPAWSAFDADVAAAATSRGIVLDMRHAFGSDPRPLLAWLEKITGRVPLAPLREMRSAPGFEPYVDAYRERFLYESRDEDVWRTLLLGNHSVKKSSPKVPPISIVVGAHCESACELVARVLQTWAGATVVGGVQRLGRLHRDSPAVRTLSASKIDLYFFATEYLLVDEIEHATGPTWDWAAPRDPVSFDGTSWANEEVRKRASAPRGLWPPACASFAGTPLDKLPPDVAKKIYGAHNLRRCPPSRRSISVTSKVPFSALRTWVAACPEPLSVSRSHGSLSHVMGAEKTLERGVSRLAQSELSELVHARCPHPPTID